MPIKELTPHLTPDARIDQPAYSICPSGEKFPLPAEEDYAKEFERI